MTSDDAINNTYNQPARREGEPTGATAVASAVMLIIVAVMIIIAITIHTAVNITHKQDTYK